MKVLLIDVDSKIPNLALMKISAYHKSEGNEVGFNITDPDMVYVSCIFKKNKEQALGIKNFYPDADILFGGSGINYNTLGAKIEYQKPDYDLYPSTYSQGYTTRGCVRNCPWCIVHDKEGQYTRHQYVDEFHDSMFDTVMIMDNNWLADKDWFFENTDIILDDGLKVIEHGMDIRLLDKEIAQRLSEMKFAKPMKFAFDQPREKGSVLYGLKLLRDAGVNIRQNVMFYVLVGYNTTVEEDLYRVNLLRKQLSGAFVMQYKRTRATRKLAHNVNRPWIYWANECVKL
jgi:hypothetical protein